MLSIAVGNTGYVGDGRTRQGERLRAARLLQRLTEADAGFNPATSERCFPICITDASHVTLLSQLLGCLRDAAPGVRVEALQMDAQTGLRLQSGDADLALGLIPSPGDGFAVLGAFWVADGW